MNTSRNQNGWQTTDRSINGCTWIATGIFCLVAWLASTASGQLAVSQQAYLKASNTEAGDWFGHFQAMWGDTLVVGTQYEDSNASGVNGNQDDNSLDAAGAAYVFVRSGTNWAQQAYLKASNPSRLGHFGIVAMSSNTIVVGGTGD